MPSSPGPAPLRALPLVDTRPFFRPLAAGFVPLLRGLAADGWMRPTVAGSWRVREVVAHLLDTTLRRLSFHRDAHSPPPPGRPIAGERDLTAFVNELNHQWIDATRRLSPRVLTDAYERAAGELADFVESYPLDGPALFPVSWAGEQASEGWFDLGREFTEQWHHQMQVREAVGAEPPSNRAWLRAVLEIAVRGLPHAYRQVVASAGDTMTVEVTGPSGGSWTLRREAEEWTVWEGAPERPTARAVLPDTAAWRLLFNALPPAQAAAVVRLEGPASLTEPLAHARSVIV